jgi:antitoxin component HigA of HigAB toxin-antitoxin module
MAAIPTLLAKPLQLDLLDDQRLVPEPEPLPEWDGGVAPPAIRLAIERELRRRGARHQDLARAIGLSRSQTTNILRGRFGTSPVAAKVLRQILGFESSAA